MKTKKLADDLMKGIDNKEMQFHSFASNFTKSTQCMIMDYIKLCQIQTLKTCCEDFKKFLFDMRTQLDSPEFDNTDAELTKEDIDNKIQELQEIINKINKFQGGLKNG